MAGLDCLSYFCPVTYDHYNLNIFCKKYKDKVTLTTLPLAAFPVVV